MRGAGDDRGNGSREETSGGRRGDGGGEMRGARGLSPPDVKPLRQKDGGDVHCSTCLETYSVSDSMQTEEIKGRGRKVSQMRKSQET